MKDNFWGLLWRSLREVNNSVITILSYVVAIVFSVIVGKTPVPLWLFVTALTITIICIATLFRALEKTLEEYNKLKRSRIPKILRVQKEPVTGVITYLLEESDLFTTEMPISFYYKDEDGYERFIGSGVVQNTQRDGKIQAVIDKPYTVDQDDQSVIVYQGILDKLANNDQKILERTEIRLGIPTSFNQS